MEEGWVKLFRKIDRNPIWTRLSSAVLKVAIGCILKANRETAQWYDGSKYVEIPRGSFVTSRAQLAAYCNISQQQARNSLEHLQRLQFVTCRGTSHYTIITVCSYETYQQPKAVGGPAEPPTDNRAINQPDLQPDRQQTTTIQELKKYIHPPYPPKGDCGEEGFTLIAPVESEKTVSELDRLVEEVATQIHARHPKYEQRCDIGVAGVVKKLKAILAHKNKTKIGLRGEELLRHIDKLHAVRCESPSWKEQGMAKGLSNWLAPTEGRYEADIPAEKPKLDSRYYTEDGYKRVMM